MTTAVFASLLNHPYAIRRLRRTPDGQGGWPQDLVAVETVQGRMRPASSSEREAAMLEERQISHVLYVLAGTDIARGDQVEGGGIVVTVDAVREPSQAGEHLEVDCQERQFETTAPEGS